MADTFVFGILSLLAAAGGAAYLFRARILHRRSARERTLRVDVAAPASTEQELRAAPTVPPKLRPPSLRPKPASQEPRSGDAGREGLPPSASKAGEAATAPPSSKGPVATQTSSASDASGAAPKSGAASKDVSPEAIRATKERSSPAKSPSEARPVVRRVPVELDEDVEPTMVGKLDFRVKLDEDVEPTKVGKLDLAPKGDEDVEPTKVGKLDPAPKGDEAVDAPQVRKSERRAIQPPVKKIVFDDGSEGEPAEGQAQLLVVYAHAQTDPGRRRKQNEDSLLVLEKQGVYVVADGMGGHNGGQYASSLAVRSLAEAFEASQFEAAAHAELPTEASELARAIQMSNATVLEHATKRPELKGMGTTIVAARFTRQNRRLYIGHIGDSRCYRVRDGVMKQITTDHTMADYGVAGPEGAHLSRALGVWPTVPIDVIMAEPKLGDLYLLCSDGLSKMVPNETIATQLLHEEDPKAAVERLVFFANAHGGKDNITVILLRVVEPGWTPPSARA